MKKLYAPEAKIQRRMYGVFDDFLWYINPHLWTALAADGESPAIDADGTGGIVQLVSGATDNDELAVVTTNELFICAADRPLYAMALLQYTEVNTDDANVAFGFADAAGANLLSDDGAGDNINNSGALIFKIDGGTTWRAASRLAAGTVSEHNSNTTAGGANYQLLEIFGTPVDGTYFEFTYFVDNVQLTEASTSTPIVHRIAYASATEMDFVAAYVKSGAGNAETVNVDYAGAWQLRPSDRLQ